MFATRIVFSNHQVGKIIDNLWISQFLIIRLEQFLVTIDDSFKYCFCRNLIEIEFELGKVSKISCQWTFNIVRAIASHYGESDFHRCLSFWQSTNNWFGLLRFCNHRLSTFKSIEWYTNNTGILWWELISDISWVISFQVLAVNLMTKLVVWNQVITLTTQSTTNYLFTQQLTAESTDTTNMCHRISIPTLCQHRYADHTLDIAT